MIKMRFWKVPCSEISSSFEGEKTNKPTLGREMPGLHPYPPSPGLWCWDVEGDLLCLFTQPLSGL